MWETKIKPGEIVRSTASSSLGPLLITEVRQLSGGHINLKLISQSGCRVCFPAVDMEEMKQYVYQVRADKKLTPEDFGIDRLSALVLYDWK